MAIEIKRNTTKRWLAHCRLLPDGHGSDDVFHVRFDPGLGAITQQLVKSVATIKNVEPTHLTPLSTCVDLEMLETFVDPDANSALYRGTISLGYEGIDITLNTEGDIWLEWNEDPEKL